MKIQTVLKSLRVAASAAVMLGVSVMASGYAHAAPIITVTFDNLPSDTLNPIPDGYAGMNWDNFYAFDPIAFGYSNGYVNGLVSPKNVAYNGYGEPAEFSNPTPFNLFGGYFTSAWNDDNQIDVIGYLAGNIVHTLSFSLDTNLPSLIAFNWFGVDRVTFTSSNLQFALDNLQLSGVSPVPVPAALPLFASAIGLGGLFAARRRKQNAA